MFFKNLRCAILIFVFLINSSNVTSQKRSEEDAVVYLENLESRYSTACNKLVATRWEYNINIQDETAKAKNYAEKRYAKFQADTQKQIRAWFPHWNQFKDESVKRQLKYLSIRGTGSMPAEQTTKMNELETEMTAAHATIQLCNYTDSNDCKVSPGKAEDILFTSKDTKELSHYWNAWFDKINERIPPSKYNQFVQLQTKAARANGFRDMSEMWLVEYDDGTPDWHPRKFKKQMEDLWEEIRPMYETFHAYVRMKLRKIDEFKDSVGKCSYIPIHFTGGFLGQEWTGLADKTKPFPNRPSLDAIEALKQKKYTPRKVFEDAAKFFTDLGLMKMTPTFWEKSVFETPAGNPNVVPNPQADDFCLGKPDGDFRIKQFIDNVTMYSLSTAHHEIGHIQYFMQYAHLPIAFREGANPAFHEAIGDTIGLAVTTPQHLQCKLKLDLKLDKICTSTESGPEDNQLGINYLYRMALDKFVLLPFAFSTEAWRWEVFEGKLKPENYNRRWWDLMKKNVGISPPQDRSEPNLFDAGGKFHIVANMPFIPYFLSNILQYQFYEAMCIAAEKYDPKPGSTSRPLYECDFDGNTKAGTLLGNMMKLGFSKEWPVALEAITGSKNLSVEPFKRYFQPLLDYMTAELDKNNEIRGYGDSCGHVVEKFLAGQYETKCTALDRDYVLADWNYSTNLTDKNSEKSGEQSLRKAKFAKDTWSNYIRHFRHESVQIENATVKRQLDFLKIVGAAALPEDKFKQLEKVKAKLLKLYGTGKICPYTNKNCNLEKEGLSLNPGIEKILREKMESEDYDELAYAWEKWRDATGRKMRDTYLEFVELQNEAAKLNGLKTATEFSTDPYQSEDLSEVCEGLWQQVKPLYQELHGYVRYKLRTEKYPKITEKGPIPAHVFGNMWSQSWKNLNKMMTPYPEATKFDATDALKKRYPETLEGLTEMFDLANEFFTSLGFKSMKESYGKKSMITRPTDREVECHASAWDMSTKDDFRLKMCTRVNHEDFVIIHHELGHIAYYMEFKDLPVTFRDAANPGFHEAIGDIIALSVGTPAHLKKVGLINRFDPVTENSTINFLMQVGLDKIALLPFCYLMDSYRWKVFDAKIPKEKLNYHWVKAVSDYQGIVPPVKRTEQDFDAGAKYHVPGDTPYIGYFVCLVLQFQIHKGLCEASGAYPARPLHECDIHGSKVAGEKFRKMLAKGRSQHWSKTLKEAIGTDKMDATAILEYFSPLDKFLKKYREEKGYPLGWSDTAFEEFVK